MKRIILFILTLSLLSTFIPCSAVGFSDVEASEAIEVITGLGIMEGYTDGTFLPENNITRAEFAKVVAGVYTYGTGEADNTSEWKETYFKDIYSGTELIPIEEMQNEEAGIFSDVPTTSWAYNSIKLVSDFGIMVGDGNGSFGADDNLTIEQALKVLVTILGYSPMAQMRGGYPSGYNAVGLELGLSKYIKGDISSYAKREDVAQMIYNAFNVELMQKVMEDGIWVQKTVEDETFLTKFLDLYSNRGRMTDNGFTSLVSSRDFVIDRVVINEEEYQLGNNNEALRDFIGRDIEYYYSDDDGDNVIVYARLSGKDTVYEIDINDFKGYKDNRIYYSEGTRSRNVAVVKAPYFINNKSAVSEFDNSVFDFNYGKITVVVSDNQNEADLIMVDSYKNFNIDYVDTDSKLMYSSSSVMGKELDVDEDEKIVRIYNPQGELISLDAVTNGSVASVAEGEGIVEIYISDEIVSDFRASVISTNANGETVLESDDGKNVILSKDYTDINSSALPVGVTYQFYLDILGRVVKFVKQSSDYSVAFMSEARMIGDEGYDGNVRIKYYDMNARQLMTGFCADTVKVIHTDDKISSYSITKTLDELYETLNSYTYSMVDDVRERTGAIFRYKADEDGNFTEIELAGSYENSNDDSSRLVEIKLANETRNLNFYNGKGLIGGNIIINDNTQILQCNFRDSSFGENKGYNLTTRSIYTENDQFEKDETKFYSTVRNSPVAEYMVENTDSSQTISARNHTLGIVTKMYQGLNDDDEAVTFIDLDSKPYAVEEDALDEGAITNMQGDSFYTSADGQRHHFELEEGDIIKYALSGSGEISAVQLLYDADADYSAGLSINGSIYNGWSQKGNLAGCIDGYYRDVARYSNPFSADNGNSFATDSYAWSYYNNYADGKVEFTFNTRVKNEDRTGIYTVYMAGEAGKVVSKTYCYGIISAGEVVYKNSKNEVIKDLTEYKGQTVSMSCEIWNGTKESFSPAVVNAFYSEGVLQDVQVNDSDTIAPESKLELKWEVKIPESDTAKILFLNSLASLKPFERCRVIYEIK